MTGRDLLLAARTLARTPVFTLTVALTLAIGIGATTAIFSVANAVLLRPLPYKDPGRLAVLYTDMRARNNRGTPFSTENFVDIREGTKGAFEDMAAVQTARQVLPAADGTPEQVRLGIVTVNFFRLMGASVVAGRDFQESDGVPQAPPQPGADPAAAPAAPPPPNMVILSHEYWQRRYGGQPVVGQRLGAGGIPLEIVGVLAPGCRTAVSSRRQRREGARRVDCEPRELQQRQPERLRPAADRPAEARRHDRRRAGSGGTGGRRAFGATSPSTAPATSTRAWSRWMAPSSRRSARRFSR